MGNHCLRDNINEALLSSSGGGTGLDQAGAGSPALLAPGRMPDLPLGKIVLVVAPHAAHTVLLDLAARLARRGPLCVLDGGNRFNAYRLARSLRRQAAEISSLLDRISLARAFTCYQMEALLADAALPALPTLVLDLLATFYDESVPLRERRWLLDRCLGHLRRLSQQAPVAVSAYPAGPGQAERLALLEMLADAAGQVWEMDAPALSPQPERLF